MEIFSTECEVEVIKLESKSKDRIEDTVIATAREKYILVVKQDR